MYLSDAVRTRIINLIKNKKITISKLSTLAAISCSTLSKFLSGKTNLIRLDIIEYICEGVGITLAEFFSSEEFFEVEVKE